MFEDKIKSIPGKAGWFNQASYKTYIIVANMLIMKGLTQDEAVEVLKYAYMACKLDEGE